MRIGILGGTFNPPHLAHLICAQEAFLQLGLDRVVLIPARIPPHKPVEEEPGPEHRLELCRLATQGDEHRFEVSDVEIAREGPSYTVDTLQELRSSAPDHELFLIVGGDIAAGLTDWREPERVLSFATLAIAKRRGTSRVDVDNALRALRGGERAQFFRMPRIAISSTMLRERVRAGDSIRYYTPDPVISYIDRHHLYAGVGSPT
ncbi:MAG: nicotinate-nucleotide adenylyltransferase [Solirubrobacteraceae bacterium]